MTLRSISTVKSSRIVFGVDSSGFVVLINNCVFLIMFGFF